MQPVKSDLPSPDKAFEWPLEAESRHNYSEAARRWAVLRRAYPGQPRAWFHGISAHIQASELEQAELLLEHARQHFPKNPNVLFHSIRLSEIQQDTKNTNILLQQAHESHPELPQTWLISSEHAENSGDLDQAMQYSKKACQLSQDKPGPLIYSAELAMRAEQWETAVELWNDLRAHFPNIPAGYIQAAEALRHLNQTEDARRLILEHHYGVNFFDRDENTDHYSVEHRGHTSLKRLLELIWTKSIFNLRSEVHRNYLSYGWWVLEPLLHLAVYYLVFGLLLKRGGENYTSFLLTGLIPWMWFSKAVSGSSNSILSGHNLMLQVGLPAVFFPLVSLLQATLKQLPAFILLIGFILLQGNNQGIHWWPLLPVFIFQGLLVACFACTVAAIIPFIRDLTYLVPTGLTFLMFLSGIFYDYRMISADWQNIFLLNPMAFLLKCYREILIDGAIPDMQSLAWWGLGCSATLIVVMIVYQHLRYIYPRIVLE